MRRLAQNHAQIASLGPAAPRAGDTNAPSEEDGLIEARTERRQGTDGRIGGGIGGATERQAAVDPKSHWPAKGPADTEGVTGRRRHDIGGRW